MNLKSNLRVRLFTTLILLILIGSSFAVAAQESSFVDSRLNRFTNNAPIILYCQPGATGFDVLRIDPITGIGNLTLTVSRTDIPATGNLQAPFASSRYVDLYRLPDGRLRAEGQAAPNVRYVFQWDGSCFDPSATETLEGGSISGGPDTPSLAAQDFLALVFGTNAPTDPIRSTANGQNDAPINREVANAPVSLFCSADNTAIEAFRIDPVTGVGQPTLNIPRNRIPRPPANEPLIFASSDAADMFRLSNGNVRLEAQFDANTKYVFEWNGTCFDENAIVRLEPGSITGGVTIDAATLGLLDNLSAADFANPLLVIDPALLPNYGPSQGIADPANLAGYVITNRSPMNFRAGPGAEYRSLGYMLGGVNFVPTGRNESQTWWRVRTTSGVEGWLRSEFMILRGDLSGVPVIETFNSNLLAPATFVTSLTKPIYTEPREADDYKLCDLAAGEYAIEGSNPRGSYYLLAGRCVDGRQVKGWVPAILDFGVLRNPSGGVLPVITPTPPPNAPQAVDGPSFLVFSVQPLYSQPNRDSAVICEVPANRFPVIGRNANSSFYQVAVICTNGSVASGWMSGDIGGFQSTTGAAVPQTAD